MKRTLLFSLALTVSLVCLQPFAASAQAVDPKLKDKKEAKGPPGKPPGKVIPHAPAGITPQANTVHTQFHKPQTPVNVPHPTNNVAVRKNTTVAASQAVPQQNVRSGAHRNVSQGAQVQNQAQFAPPQGNRSNHYGGHWIAGSDHPDWGNSGEHYWNHHHYRWYDGGWVIFDSGYAPAAGGPIGAVVQQRLTEEGYYNGPVDGDVGPGTSQAIANYQGDHGLRPTGHINHHLLDSLGIQ